MKKGTLNFLGRKNPSLFDTNVKMKDMEDVELVLSSGSILESGTASVRARPTVKHYSTSDSFQAFAVPTPTVPHYSPVFNGTKINGSVGDDQSSNGSTISVTDPIEGEIFVPAPPSMAPPPPPAEVFVLPPPEFMGDLSTLQLPPMAAPKPLSLQEDKFTFMAPPPISPPKPTNGSVSPAPVSSPVATSIPEPPKYAPPQPPADKPKNSVKKPPPKPIRISSVNSLDSPPDTPAPPPPVHTPTLSSFNPQSPAKLYSAPKSTFLNEEPVPKIKPKLLLEDYRAGPVVQNNTNVRPKSMEVQKDIKTQPKSIDVQEDIKQRPKSMVVQEDVKAAVPKPVQEVREIETAPKISPPPPPSTPPKPVPDRKPLTAASLKEINKTPQTSPLLKANRPQDTMDKPNASPTLNGKYSPLLDRKLRNISGSSAPKDTSPLALLKAAKQREKHRTSTTQENSALSQNSLLSTNSGSNLSLNSMEGRPESPKSEPIYAMPVKKTKEINPVVPSASLLLNKAEQPKSPSLTAPDLPKTDDKPDFGTSFLPPPPEFDDLDDIEPPPSMKPPDPPKLAAPAPPAPPTPPKLPAQTPIATPVIQTPPKPAPAPPPLPQLPPPTLNTTVKTKPPPVLVKPKTAPPPAPAPLPTPATPSQATLLNILKKKMIEMDQKMGPNMSEQEPNVDDWGSPEDNEVPVIPRVNSPKNTAFNKSATLDMKELRTKAAQKTQQPNRIPIPTSNGPSRHQYGMTFTVRPGTKQPITLVSKGE